MKLLDTFYDEYHRWPLWVPVLIGSGVAFFFSLHEEPSFIWAALPLFFLPGLWAPSLLRLISVAFLCLSLGFTAGIIRTHSLPTQMLKQELGPLWIEGQVESVEEKITSTGKTALRVILSDMDGISDLSLPEKVRLTLRGKFPDLRPGQRIRTLAKLLPFSGPTHPGGYDFRRQAYFMGLEATGFNLNPPKIVEDLPPTHWQHRLENLRQSMTHRLKDSLPAPQGGIAAALITGDRASIPDSIRDTFAASGLAHILAISGLHLSIVAGLVFLLFRRGGALIPPLALTFNTKKIAALAAMGVTALYLGISGFGIPAQRPFMMTCLVMMAILLNRNALSLRTVACAATLILLVTPEKLISPSFQLSFAAVTALIAAYEAWQNPLERWLGRGGLWRWGIVYFGSVAFTSLIATLATLPFTVMTFNRFTLMAVFANMLAVPLTAFVIMPVALVTVTLMPLGLEGLIFPLLNTSLLWLQDIANWAATLPGANITVATPSTTSFALVVMGALWLCLWLKPWRLWGLAPLSLGMVLANFSSQPDILIDEQGKLVGLRDSQNHLHVTSLRRGKFQRESWLKSLGDQAACHLPCDFGSCQMEVKGHQITIINQAYDLDKGRTLLVNLTEHACPTGKRCISKQDLESHGSHALYLQDNGEIRIRTTANQRVF